MDALLYVLPAAVQFCPVAISLPVDLLSWEAAFQIDEPVHLRCRACCARAGFYVLQLKQHEEKKELQQRLPERAPMLNLTTCPICWGHDCLLLPQASQMF